MKITELVSKLDYHFNTLAGEVITDPDRVRSLRRTQISGIVNDSRQITENCLFFCIKGAVRDSLSNEGEISAILQFFKEGIEKPIAFTTTDVDGNFAH